MSLANLPFNLSRIILILIRRKCRGRKVLLWWRRSAIMLCWILFKIRRHSTASSIRRLGGEKGRIHSLSRRNIGKSKSCSCERLKRYISNRSIRSNLRHQFTMLEERQSNMIRGIQSISSRHTQTQLQGSMKVLLWATTPELGFRKSSLNLQEAKLPKLTKREKERTEPIQSINPRTSKSRDPHPTLPEPQFKNSSLSSTTHGVSPKRRTGTSSRISTNHYNNNTCDVVP